MLIISVISVLLVRSATGQQYFMEIYDREDGMPANEILDIAQDSTGFIWLLSDLGITRYDGSYFHQYPMSEISSDEFPSSEILKLYADNNGGIWVSNQSGGIFSYNPVMDQFDVRNDSSTRLPSAAYSYYNSDSAILWMGTAGQGLVKWDRIKNTLKIYTQDDNRDSLQDNFISTIRAANDSLLIVTTTKGSAIFDPSSEKFFRLWFNASDGETYKHNVIRYSLGLDGINYTTTYWGLHITDLQTREIVHLTTNTTSRSTINHNSLWEMAADKEGRIWIASYGGGVNIYDPASASFTYLTMENSSLPENNIIGVFRDREGSIWLRTSSSGIVKIDFRKQWIRRIEMDKYGLPYVTSAIAVNDSIIWMGTNGKGLVRFNRKSDEISMYTHEPLNPNSLAYDHISAIDMDTNGVIWIATAGDGMDSFDPSTGLFEHFPYAPNDQGVSNSALKSVSCFGKDVYFITYGNGFGVYDQVTGSIESFWDAQETGTVTPIKDTNMILHDSQGNNWILTSGGVIVRDHGSSRFQDAINMGRIESPFSSFDFLSMKEVSPGVFYIANNAGEIAFIRYQGGGEVIYDQFIPSSSRDHVGLLHYEDSVFWQLNSGGLVRVDLRSDTRVEYKEEDGLLGNEFYPLTGKDQYTMLVASLNGLNIVDREKVPSPGSKRRVIWNELSVLNRPVQIGLRDSLHGLVLDQALNYTSHVELDYGHKEFSVSFSALQFYAPERTYFRYRLVGFVDDWIYGNKQNKISYTNLDPGDYEFEVQAALLPGEWGPVKSLSLHINPPFWMTWWFLLLAGTGLVGLLYLFHTYRIQKAVALANLRTQLAQDLHDDIGSSLTKISLYSSLMAEEKESNGVAGQIGELSREVISQMSDIIWSVDQKNDSVENLLSRMRLFAEETLMNCGMEIKFEKDIQDGKMILNPLFRQNYYLIFKEAINNICKHSGARNVWVRIRQERNQLHMEIADNGVGLNGKSGSNGTSRAFAISSGNGLGNMKKRAERIGISFQVGERDGGGTRIYLGRPT